MDRTKFKQIFILITYTVLLVMVVIYFRSILGYLGKIISLFTPLFIAIAIAFILNGPYKRLRGFFTKVCKFKDGIAKGVAIALVYILAFGFIILLFRFIVPEIGKNVANFTENFEGYLSRLMPKVNNLLKQIGLKEVSSADLYKMITDRFGEIQGALAGLIPTVISVTSSVMGWIFDIVIAIILSFYVLAGQEKLANQAKRMGKAYLPDRILEKVAYIVNITGKVFRNYITGQALDAVLLGTAVGIACGVVGLDYAALSGIIVGVFTLIPVLGAFIGGALAGFLQLLVSPQDCLTFLILLLIIQQFDNAVTYPRIVGDRVGLPGIWVLTGVTVGGGLFGIVGMFIGVPLTTVLYVLIRTDVNERNGIPVIPYGEKTAKADGKKKKGRSTLIANLLQIDPHAEVVIENPREHMTYATEEEKKEAEKDVQPTVRKKFKR